MADGADPASPVFVPKPALDETGLELEEELEEEMEEELGESLFESFAPSSSATPAACPPEMAGFRRMAVRRRHSMHQQRDEDASCASTMAATADEAMCEPSSK